MGALSQILLLLSDALDYCNSISVLFLRGLIVALDVWRDGLLLGSELLQHRPHLLQDILGPHLLGGVGGKGLFQLIDPLLGFWSARLQAIWCRPGHVVDALKDRRRDVGSLVRLHLLCALLCVLLLRTWLGSSLLSLSLLVERSLHTAILSDCLPELLGSALETGDGRLVLLRVWIILGRLVLRPHLAKSIRKLGLLLFTKVGDIANVIWSNKLGHIDVLHGWARLPITGCALRGTLGVHLVRLRRLDWKARGSIILVERSRRYLRMVKGAHA